MGWAMAGGWPTAEPTARKRLAAPNRRTITALIWDNGRVVKQRRRKESPRVTRSLRPIVSIWSGLSRRSDWGSSLILRAGAWRIDNDGDLCGLWEGHLFCFRFLGDTREVLSIVAFMKQLIPLEYGDDLRDFLQAWHGEFLWPKAYVAEQLEGDRVVAEVNGDYEYGATDAQLVQQVMCAASDDAPAVPCARGALWG